MDKETKDKIKNKFKKGNKLSHVNADGSIFYYSDAKHKSKIDKRLNRGNS